MRSLAVTALLLTLAIALLATPLALEAQQAEKARRVGILVHAPEVHPWEIFRQTLWELGYLEGQTLTIEWRFADARTGRLTDLAAELVRLKVDVIVTPDTIATQAAKQATTTIPIVMAAVADPVGTGLVASLARPGGNITGMSWFAPEISGKRLELFKEAVPDEILKGAKPRRAPHRAADEFELVINMKTAKALGLTIPRRCWSGPIRLSSETNSVTRGVRRTPR